MKPTLLALASALLYFGPSLIRANEPKAPKSPEEATRQIQKFLGDFSIDAKPLQKEQSFVEFLAAVEASFPKDKKLTVRLDEPALGKDSDKIAHASVKLATADGTTTTPDEAMRSAFSQLRRFGNLDYAILPQGITITRPELAVHWLTYDIREFIDRVPTLSPLAKMRSGKEGQNVKPSEAAATIVRYLADSIELQPWEEIQAINGVRLTARASATRHRQIENRLEFLRIAADTAVVMNARLYEVDRSFYAKNIAPRYAKDKDTDQSPTIIRLEGPLFEKIVQQKVLLESEPVKLWPDREVEFLSQRSVFHSAAAPKFGKEERRRNDATIGVSFEVRPQISPDRRFLRLHITQKATRVLRVDKIKKLDVSTGKDVEVDSPNLQGTSTAGTIQIADGCAFLMPVDYRPLGKENADKIWLLAACPVIWIDAEEKEKQGPNPVISAQDPWNVDFHEEMKPTAKPTPLTDDEKQILQAVITDILTNPELKHLHRSYGDEKDKTFRLVDSGAVSWPPDFQLETHGYKQIHEDRDPFAEPRRVLGISVSKMDLKQKKALMFNTAVEVGVTDANGSVLGGCRLYYDPKKAGKRWTVELCELLSR